MDSSRFMLTRMANCLELLIMWKIDEVPVYGRIMRCMKCQHEIHYLTDESYRSKVCQKCRLQRQTNLDNWDDWLV
jgi:hypothetical protein